MWPTERGGVLCVTTHIGSWSPGYTTCRLLLAQWNWQKMSRQQRPRCRVTERERFRTPLSTINFASYTFYSSSSTSSLSLFSHSFRVKLMQRKTVLRPPHSLARLFSPPVTLRQRKSRLISRAWPARERPCWPPGKRNRQSWSSAWSCSCF